MKPFLLLVFAVPLALSACLPGFPTAPPQPQVITVVVEVTQAPAGDTPTVQPASATADLPVTGPSCVMLQNVNFRSGPGLVFDPPFNVLRKDTAVIPEGFARQGFPGGSWVLVSNPATGERGWIASDPGLVTCTVDVTALPVAAAPPTPVQLRLRSSRPEGSPNGIEAQLHFSPRELLRFEAIGPGGARDGDYIKNVRFLVRDDSGAVFYEVTEGNPAFCIFGGDQGCNPWPKRDGYFVWGPSGERVQDGKTYLFDIFATAETTAGEVEGNWNFTVEVDLP